MVSDHTLTKRDRAKREFTINSSTEIDILKRKYKISDDGKTVKPYFFKMITTENGYELSDSIRYRHFNTSMDYLQKIISRFNFRSGREQRRDILPFMTMIKEPTNNVRQGYYYRQRDRIIEVIRAANDEKRRLFSGYDTMSPDERDYVWRCVADIKQDCIEEVELLSGSPSTMYLVLKDIDNAESADVARFVFEVLFGSPNKKFFEMIKDSREDIYTLEECDDGDIDIYGFRFAKTPLLRCGEQS